MRNSRIIVLVTIFVISITAISNAQSTRENTRTRGEHNGMTNRGGRGGGDMIIKMLLEDPDLVAEVGLDEKQIQEIKESTHDSQLLQIDLEAEKKKAALEQARLVSEKDVDEDAIMDAIDKSAAIQAKIAKARMKHMLQMKAIITPEQSKKIREVMQKRIRERMHNHDRRNKIGDNQSMQNGNNGMSDEMREKFRERKEQFKKNRDGGHEREKDREMRDI